MKCKVFFCFLFCCLSTFSNAQSPFKIEMPNKYIKYVEKDPIYQKNDTKFWVAPCSVQFVDSTIIINFIKQDWFFRHYFVPTDTLKNIDLFCADIARYGQLSNTQLRSIKRQVVLNRKNAKDSPFVHHNAEPFVFDGINMYSMMEKILTKKQISDYTYSFLSNSRCRRDVVHILLNKIEYALLQSKSNIDSRTRIEAFEAKMRGYFVD